MFQRVVSVPLQALKWLAFGSVQFSEQEEYLEFRYKFLIVLMLTAAALTGLFILGLVSQINLIGWAHGRMMIIYVIGTVILWLFLWPPLGVMRCQWIAPVCTPIFIPAMIIAKLKNASSRMPLLLRFTG